MSRLPEGKNTALIKAALIKDLRVGVFFINDETTVEYHFIKDPRCPPNTADSITCVMYTSTTTDPLKWCGITQPLETFIRMFDMPIIFAGSKPYRRTDIRLFPGDWYPCFEKDIAARIAQVDKMEPELQKLASVIALEDEKQEQEKRIREEEDRKNERRPRNPWSLPTFGLNVPAMRPEDMTDNDISDMISKGFLPSFFDD